MPVLDIELLMTLFPGSIALLTLIYLLKDEFRLFLTTGKIVNKESFFMRGGYLDKRIEKILKRWTRKASTNAAISNTIKILKWNISEIRMRFIRYITVAIVFTVGGLVLITNANISKEELIKDMNYGTSFIDVVESQAEHSGSVAENIEQERKLVNIMLERIKHLEKQVSRDYPQLEKHFESISINYGDFIISNIQKKRVIKKALLLFYRESLGEKARGLVGLLLICIMVYFSPNGLVLIKKEIVKRKKEKEIILIYNGLMLYKELPPYDTKILLEHLISMSEEYRGEISRILESIKNGNSEECFEESRKMALANEEEGFVDFLEQIRLFYITGKLERSGAAQRYIDMKMKVSELTEERARNSTFQLVSLPFAVTIALGAWYFMLGTMSLSNTGLLGK